MGSAIVKRLTGDGHQVLALYRAGSGKPQLPDATGKLEWVEGDVLDITRLDQLVAEVDRVVHTAAMVSFVPRDRVPMFQVNVEGTANVVNACLKNRVGKLCHVSSVAALGRPAVAAGQGGGEIVIDERQRWTDSSENSTYSQTKYYAELEVWRGITEGLNAVIVNPSVILGEGDWTKSSTRLFKYVYDENKFYTEGLLNYVDVKDVSDAVCRLLASDTAGERFILNGGTVSYREFFDQAARVFGKRPPSRKVNPLLAGLVWRIEALRSLVTGSAPLLTRETARAAQHRYRFEGQKIRQETGLEYHSLESTLRRIGESFKNAGLIL